ncbi:DUF2341 domain-containing protein, partial [Candidatus Dojkabacteria bacterium]|nr:DUF2341 domain-containing protein [Candidatus Dojkabacteria bacterium]
MFKIYRLNFRKLLKSKFLILWLLIVVSPFLLTIQNIKTVKAQTGWYDVNWLYRKKITFTSDTNKIPSTQINFPVVISIDSDTNLAVYAQDDGDDFVFTSSDGATKLDHEIETFNGSTGKLVAHVKVSTLSAGGSIYLYYGNNTATNQENKTDVWGEGYAGVWHMNETSGTVYDSTNNDNDGTPLNGVIQNTAGKMGSGSYFDGTDDYILTTDDLSWVAGESFTMCTWFNAETFPAAPYRQVLIGKFPHEYSLLLEENQINFYYGFWMWTGGNLNLDEWYHICITYDGVEGMARSYLNGIHRASQSHTGGFPDRSIPTEIGSGYGWTWYERSFFNGTMDEVQITNSTFSSDWIKTEYSNQNDPSSFYTIVDATPSINNLSGLLNAINIVNDDVISSDEEIPYQGPLVTAEVKDITSDYVVSRMNIDLTDERDWTGVAGSSDGNKSYFHYPGGYNSIPGALGNGYELYIPRESGQVGVHICPGASSLSEVNLSCSDGYTLPSTAGNVTQVNIDGTDYWRVSGMTGTGGLGTYQTGVTFTLTPNESALSTAQDVTATYTTNGGFATGDIIEITWESGSGLTVADCSTAETDADNDGTPDGAVTIVNGGLTYRYTFTAATTQTSISLCANITGYDTMGSYSVTLDDDNGQFGAALYHIEDNNDVFVTANISPTLSFNIRTLDDTADTNVCDLGTVDTTTDPNQ